MNKEKARNITKELKKLYGTKIPLYLHFNKKKPYEFLFAVMMSARCKDDSVNKVTEKLYKKYNNIHAFAHAKLKDFEKDIYSLGFYHDKAKNVLACALALEEKYNGKVPNTFEELVDLPGVGRKTANVVLPTLYNIPAMAVDTHVARLTKKIFGVKASDPKKIEEFLCSVVDKKDWHLWNTHLIAHGRKVCTGERPKCEICSLKKYCNFYK